MIRADIITTVGRDFLTSNIENDEFSYPKAYSNASLPFTPIRNRAGRAYEKLDIRFVKDNISVLIETKQNFHTNIEDAKEQLCDDNSVYQFTRKVKALPGGALFKYDNGCSVFLSYNFFSILKESNFTQSRLSLDMFRAVTEKFFIEYHQDLSAILPLANTLVQFCCHSLSNQNPEHYVCCQKAKVSSNKLVVDFEVNSSKIASDIAEAIDRSVEYSVIGELLQPLVCLSKDSYSELFEKMELTSGQKKTLGTTAVRIDYYFNPDTYEIKETDVSELSIRKQIAKISSVSISSCSALKRYMSDPSL